MTTIPRASGRSPRYDSTQTGTTTQPTAPSQSVSAPAAGTDATTASAAAVPGTWAHAVAHRQPGCSLEAPFYTDPDYYRKDLEAVFQKTWIFAASVAELPEPGDYITLDVGRASVIIIRDDDEQIRAHHNV